MPAARMMPASVSTHSRPKAAGGAKSASSGSLIGFNTQPPEGGWRLWSGFSIRCRSFNTQPPEGGWGGGNGGGGGQDGFNTQPPEGGWKIRPIDAARVQVSTHSRPKAAGDPEIYGARINLVSTHSRPKAAGLTSSVHMSRLPVSTHSRPKAAGF